jgi:hypothetical protein
VLWWRLLLPLSRLTKTYHALSREGKHSERIHHHTRQRYGAGGKDLTGRIKRRSLTATQLRFDASRIIEWFRILLRHGWPGSHRHLNTRQPRTCKPGWYLANTLGIRRRHHVNRPYGSAALRLGLVRPADPPVHDPPG